MKITVFQPLSDVEDAINRARGRVWNGVKVNPVGTRPTSTIVRGDSDRHFATRTGGAEEVGTIIREGSTVASNTNLRGNTMEGGDSRGRMVRNLPYLKFLKRREEDRCFQCGGPFAPGHRCSEKSLRVLLLAEEEEDEVIEGENPDTNPYTVSLGDGHKRTSRGPCEKIRINLGEATVEEELKLPIIDTPPYSVSQGDGHQRMTRGRCEKVRISFKEATLEEEFYAFDLGEVDAILGVAWLGKLGELLINWEEMTMMYYLEGKRIRIIGHQVVSLQLVESKLTNVESWAIGAELQVGLQAHYHVFQEKQGLLPLRNIQHRILLKDVAMLYNGQLYTTARVSSFVLTYYGLCLINGNYTIKFHFAEIIFINEKSLNSLGKRVFGVYIQGNLVLEDFDIQGEAGGTGRSIVTTFNASFTHHTLKIHFYRAGKGTPGISTRGVYGPLVSANLVGEDEFGYMLTDILKENNVNHEGMRFDPGARTALAFVILRSDGEREFMFYRNPRADMLLQEDELDLDLIRTAKIFHYGSISLITEPCNSAHIAVAKAANDAGVVLSYDPNLRLPLWPFEDSATREGILSIWETVDIIKVSEEEISFLTKGEDPHDDVVVRKIFHENPKLLIVTEGAEGCRYYTKEFSGRVKGLKVDVVDTTGAGDAFIAGMLSQLAANLSLIQKEEELRDSLKFANVCGALIFGYPGLIHEFNLGDKVVEEGGNDRRLRNQNEGKQKEESSHRRKGEMYNQARRDISFFGKNISALTYLAWEKKIDKIHPFFGRESESYVLSLYTSRYKEHASEEIEFGAKLEKLLDKKRERELKRREKKKRRGREEKREKKHKRRKEKKRKGKETREEERIKEEERRKEEEIRKEEKRRGKEKRRRKEERRARENRKGRKRK
ncbi:hypothetical protein V8G54_016064 [Vigna mungo]|uniref:Carbohydrate kinase PfkB domain-containing protein n=1 Tax=Vigna mungo TaxID=3915 RepID=A0AAQ3NJJ8_VIGMU